jgi:hypothetical protein
VANDGGRSVSEARAEAGPELLVAADDRERLLAQKRTAVVYDTIRQQLAELIETRTPDRKLSAEELRPEVDGLLAGDPDAYGCWAYYPWSNRLVHVLPQRLYSELRGSRNRNKITLSEQQRLQTATLGVVGLSVGQATAVTLALEGLGGTLRLADFDELSLSNLNRLRASVHEIGINKAVITARAIWELNPYARLELFTEGVTEHNLARFMDGLDLLLEECDDLKTKVLLREEARRRRIPVLMETSDRGLFDVERFDLEPKRALFHGLVGELRAEQLAGLTTYQKVPVVLAIVGADTMSPRLAASMVDVETSLKTWPQLASAVALGGAINTDATRRILLGQFHSSGRYFVDLEQIVADGRGAERQQVVDTAARTIAPGSSSRPRRDSCADPGKLAREQVEQLVALASLAPSGGNAQPWRFVYQRARGVLECWLVPERAASFLDYEQRASYLAFGALSENLRLGAQRMGLDIAIEVLPDASRETLILEAHLGPRGVGRSDARDALLSDWIEKRVTNRKLGPRVELPASLGLELAALFQGSSCSLDLIRDPSSLRAFGDLHGETERLRTLHPQMHRDLMAEIRWSSAEAERTRDGIDLATLELTPTDRAGLTVLSRDDVIETMRGIDAGQGLRQASRKALAGASAIGLVRSRGESPAHYVEAGSKVQQAWLLAQARGFSVQPLTAMLYVFARLDHGASGLSESEHFAFTRARSSLHALFPTHHEVVQGPASAARERTTDVFAFRLAQAGAPSARALRRTVDELLELR